MYNCMWALQRVPGGPWPSQNFGWMGYNAFGLTNDWLVYVDSVISYQPIEFLPALVSHNHSVGPTELYTHHTMISVCLQSECCSL